MEDGAIVSEMRGISLTQQDMEAIQFCLEKRPDVVLESSSIRMTLAQNRVRRLPQENIRQYKARDGSLVENAIEHNLAGLLSGNALARPERLISALKLIDYISFNLPHLKVLSVGPRSEAEIFGLVSMGFDAKNIRGLDLISYSPFVDLGDMHELPYLDASFDVIVLGWVLAYSKNIGRVVSEIYRVAKPGAVIAVGCEYNPASSEELAKHGQLKTDYPRFNHSDDILKHFEGKIETVIVRHDIRPSMRNQVGSIITVFELKK